MRELQARRKKSHRTLIPAAAAHLIVQGNLNIITEAAMGEREVFLTLQRDFHQIMAGGSDGKNGHARERRPFPSVFIPSHRGSPPQLRRHRPQAASSSMEQSM